MMTGELARISSLAWILLAICPAAFSASGASGGGMSGPLAASPATSTGAAGFRPAPSYDSDYSDSVNSNPSLAGNSPEDDARPGVYYFNLGAKAFVRNDYQHAIDMYQVAASWAYKPAAYNLAVMYARGQGVPADLPRAMAWIALAAERNDKQYVEVRELIYSLLTKQQFEQANTIWRDLKNTYGDEIAMPRAKARWAEVRNGMTGSHLGHASGPLAVGIPTPHVSTLPPPPGAAGPAKIGVVPGQIIHGDAVDGSVAYGQLHESDNPYDPKFERRLDATATVGPMTEVKDDAKKSDAATPKP